MNEHSKLLFNTIKTVLDLKVQYIIYNQTLGHVPVGFSGRKCVGGLCVKGWGDKIKAMNTCLDFRFYSATDSQAGNLAIPV